MKIKNSVVLVTGANRGIGKSFVRALIDKGAAKVYACNRVNEQYADPRVVSIELDVTNVKQIEELAEECKDTTLLINNAGVLTSTLLLEKNAIEKARHEIEVNYLGPLAMCNTFKNVSGIINVVSVAAWAPYPGIVTYCASKAALGMLTHGLQLETTAHVMGVYMGFVNTSMAEKYRGSVAMIEPEEVAIQSLEMFEKGKTEFLVDDYAKSIKMRFWE